MRLLHPPTLHMHGLQDLCEKLCSISDHRREGAEGERERVLSDQWVEDHVGIITNHYISILQVSKSTSVVFFLTGDY